MNSTRIKRIIGLLLVASGQSAIGIEGIPDWENPAVFERNQTSPHTPVIPYQTLAQAQAEKKEACPFYLSLNGPWCFRWCETPKQAPAAFYREDFDITSWSRIKVPANWQMEGFGHPKFRNIAMPFPSDPPRVPAAYNPVGLYRREFSVPLSWQGRRLFLRFEGVKSASTVWMNGREVGYNEGGFEPAEYDVTDQVRPGRNMIAVRVLRYSDGSYLENQDMWRLSGIYRDVTLFATPHLHMRDYYIRTDFDETYRDARLRVDVELQNQGTSPQAQGTVRMTLWDAGRRIGAWQQTCTLASATTATLQFDPLIEQPRAWSAEKPNLYQLGLELLDPNGQVIEAYCPAFGFRETEIKGNTVTVNGRAVKFNGVNSHIHHPTLGNAMDVETLRRDFTLMKQFNINLVRTSHYPPPTEYLDLADAYGLYVIDETPDECHKNIQLSEQPEWRDMFVDRARQLVLRDRNHPCVVFWSGGNEAGVGENLKVMIEEGRRLDPSRPHWMYGGNTFEIPFEDIIGPRYWTPKELSGLAQQDPSEDSRPSFMDEYLAATGNSLGAMDEYWELIWKHPRLTGGAIWDWVSPAIQRPLNLALDRSAHRNHGAIMGRARTVSGPAGQAIDLSGHDEWVELYRDPSLDITGNQLTLEMWVKLRPFVHSNVLLAKGGHQYGLLQEEPGDLTFYIYTEDEQRVTARGPAPVPGHWHHVAGIYDGQALSLYIDGQLRAQTPCTQKIFASPFPVNLGRDSEKHGSETEGFLSNASIDAVRIYDEALSIEELRSLSPRAAAQRARLCLDFENIQEKGSFHMTGLEGRTYGLIWADRRIQPELWQVKRSGQRVHVEAINLTERRFRVTNRFHFTHLKEVDTVWQIKDGQDTVAEGKLSLDIGPQAVEEITLPIPVQSPATSVRWLLLSFRTQTASTWAPAGHEVAWEQFSLAPPTFAHNPKPDLPLRTHATGETYVVTGQGFTYTADKTTGRWSQLEAKGQSLTHPGPRFNVWRAPLANDIDPWNRWHWQEGRREGRGRSRDNNWRVSGIDRLSYRVEDMSLEQPSPLQAILTVAESVTTASGQGGFKNTYRYTIDGSGEMVLAVESRPWGTLPAYLPRLGLQLQIPDTMNRVTYLGRGPFENYPDRKTGAKIGVYETRVDDMIVPYLIPQDYGNRCDVHWVKLTDSAGFGFSVQGEPFNFSAHPYATDHLERASYRFQLKRSGSLYLNIDPVVTGVGDTSRSTLDAYRVRPEIRRFTLRMRPVAP